MECNFLYCGLSFLLERHKVPKSLMALPVPNKYISVQMCKVIEEEEEVLKKTFNRLLKKTNSPIEFVQVKPGLFLYCYNIHIPMSSVTLTLLQRCGMKFEGPLLGELEPCSITHHGYHDGYLPFFNDNNSLTHIYQRILHDTSGEAWRKEEVIEYYQLLSRVMRTKMHRSTRFHTNALPTTTSWEMGEDEWTMILSKSLERYLPENVTLNCCCKDGLIFKDYQAIYSETTFGGMYLFQGAPDMILSSHRERCRLNPDTSETDSDDNDSLVNIDANVVDTDSSDTDDDTIEMEKQSGTINKLMNLPEKLGQVTVGLQFLLVAKVMRMYMRKHSCDSQWLFDRQVKRHNTL